MTTFSLNNQFDKLVKVTAEQQTLTKTDNMQQKVMDESAKSQDFSLNNKPSQKENTQQQEYNQEIFYQIFCMLELIRKISLQ